MLKQSTFLVSLIMSTKYQPYYLECDEVEKNYDIYDTRYLKDFHNIKLSANSEYVGRYCLWLCTNITELPIPKNVERTGFAAFSDYFNLEFVEMTDSIKELGELAFDGCEKIKYINLSNRLIVLPKKNI